MKEVSSKLNHLPFNEWDDEIVRLVMEITELKGAINSPAVSKETAAAIKHWVQVENAIKSNRIEGNHTTHVELEEGLKGNLPVEEKRKFRILETTNHYKAEDFINLHVESSKKEDLPAISEGLIRECHKILMDGIPKEYEGVATPGAYRVAPVKILNSDHVPPDNSQISSLVAELVEYCRNVRAAEILVSAAIAHHRFAWIHPFENGNGRSARLFTYALLKANGFHFNGMVSLPRAFERARSEYMRKLNEADNGDLKAWIRFFLGTLLSELKTWSMRLAGNRIEKIIDDYLQSLRAQRKINESEMKCLRYTYLSGVITNEDARRIANVERVQASRILSGLEKKKLLERVGARKGFILPLNMNFRLLDFYMPD